VALACSKLADYPEHERVAKVLVVLSDGDDNSSHRSLRQVIEDAETSGVTIYTVSTKEVTGAKSNADKILDALAERSGGESMFPGDIFALDRSLDKLRELIRSRYLIAYKPAAFEPNGKYRTIKITAERDGKHLQVHARKGYYSRNEATRN
jgi:Ca-activated chloride channel homolog